MKKLYKGIVMYISHILNVSDAIFIDNNKDGCPCSSALFIDINKDGCPCSSALFIDIKKDGCPCSSALFIDISKYGWKCSSALFIDINKDGCTCSSALFIDINKDGVTIWCIPVVCSLCNYPRKVYLNIGTPIMLWYSIWCIFVKKKKFTV